MPVTNYVFAVVAFLTDLYKETDEWQRSFCQWDLKPFFSGGKKTPRPLKRPFFMGRHSYASKTLNVIQVIAMPAKI